MDPYTTQTSPDVEPSTGPGLIIKEMPQATVETTAQVVESTPEKTNVKQKATFRYITNIVGLIGFVAIVFPIVVGVLAGGSGMGGLVAIMYGFICWPIGAVALIAFAILKVRQRRYSDVATGRGRIVSTILITIAVFIAVLAVLYIASWYIG